MEPQNPAAVGAGAFRKQQNGSVRFQYRGDLPRDRFAAGAALPAAKKSAACARERPECRPRPEPRISVSAANCDPLDNAGARSGAYARIVWRSNFRLAPGWPDSSVCRPEGCHPSIVRCSGEQNLTKGKKSANSNSVCRFSPRQESGRRHPCNKNFVRLRANLLW